ncbi:MAG: diacylglycerol/lipid kinase family protein [Solirubrobacterales bacterium]
MSSQRSHLLLVNPASGGGRAASLLPEVERELGERGIRFRTVETRSLEHGVGEARTAAEGGEIPVVMSGDGLIGQVGGALAGGDTPMGIVPGGRGNDLARVLEIPAEPAGAAEVLAAGHEREIDVGEVNERRFLCIASCGFDSVANRIANRARLVRGNLVYAYAALRALATWRPARFDVTLDGGPPRRFEGYSVAVANSRAYGGGMIIAPAAELDDGLYDVVISGTVGKLRFLANLPKVFKGTHVAEPEVTVLRASRVEVSADRDFAVYADGEHLADLPAGLRVLPRALRVIAPPAGASR